MNSSMHKVANVLLGDCPKRLVAFARRFFRGVHLSLERNNHFEAGVDFALRNQIDRYMLPFGRVRLFAVAIDR